MSLMTGWWLLHDHWTELPMPHDAITRVRHLGHVQGMPKSLTFADWYGFEFHDAVDDVDDDHDLDYDPVDDNASYSVDGTSSDDDSDHGMDFAQPLLGLTTGVDNEDDHNHDEDVGNGNNHVEDVYNGNNSDGESEHEDVHEDDDNDDDNNVDNEDGDDEDDNNSIDDNDNMKCNAMRTMIRPLKSISLTPWFSLLLPAHSKMQEWGAETPEWGSETWIRKMMMNPPLKSTGMCPSPSLKTTMNRIS